MFKAASVLCLALATAVLGLPASAGPKGPKGEQPLMVQFSGTGGLMTLAEALDMAGVDLARDTRLSAMEIADFEANATGCWATPMLDARTQKHLGTGVDCLELLPGSDPGVGVSLRALSIFVFSRGRGSALVTFGLTTVRPFIPGIGDADGAVTHLTGSIPSGPGGIVGGTGRFANAAGSARVSGAVALGAFPDALTFDCLWRLGVEKGSTLPRRRR